MEYPEFKYLPSRWKLDREKEKAKKKVPTHYFLCPHCGEQAFQLTRMPAEGDRITLADIIHEDDPKTGDEVTCQVCHRGILNVDLKVSNIYALEDWCEFCGGTGEITEGQYDDIRTRPCHCRQTED